MPSTLLGNITASTPDPSVDGSWFFCDLATVARFGPSGFTVLPPTFGAPQSLIVNAVGNLVAGTTTGAFELIAGTWARIGGAFGLTGAVLDLELLPGGVLLAGGSFNVPGQTGTFGLATWNGASWAPVAGVPPGTAERVEVFPNGDLLFVLAVAGTSNRQILALRGGVLQRLAAAVTGPVHELAILPDGDVVAGGSFTSVNAFAITNLARLNGQTWSPLASGFNGDVRAVKYFDEGVLAVGGLFTSIAGQNASFVAGFTATVPGTVTPTTAGCGPTLHSLTPPFLGTTHRTLVSGLQPGVAFQALGVSLLPVPIPLSSLLPGAPPVCTIDVTLNTLLAHACTTTAVVTIIIPDDPAFLNVVVFEQVANLGASGAASISGAHAVQIGAF
ncbi:MAG: hypothetical protein JNM84_06695 [Planctomycetes bacterium]|nr:hypothetical protein [Planctomycetota bacterium]